MQIGARYESVLELITEIFSKEKPADNVINEYMRARKYIGSKDRRFITENVWNIIRNRLKLEFDAQSKEYLKILLTYLKDENLEEIFSGEKYALSVLSLEEKEWLQNLNEEPYPEYVEAECPEWIYKRIPNMDLFKSLNRPASADFRINIKNRLQVIENLQKEGFELYPTPYSPIGLRSDERISLGNCVAYVDGEIEVQDEASQLAAILCDVKPEHKVIDYCCGAGGKSLTMAYLLQNRGQILAHDVDSRRMEALRPRMVRLKVKNIEISDIIATSDKEFDRFVLDAPCSGTGTWRRSPDAKFRLNLSQLEKLNKIQAELLQIAYEKTKIGGEIIYITCSVLPDENENIIGAFLKENQNVEQVNMKERWERLIGVSYPYSSEKYLRLSPLTTNTDGFFISVLKKKA